MKNLTRAERKKAQRQFKVGDIVTWGDGFIAHRVVEVRVEGVVVDVTSQTDAHFFADPQPDGRFFLLVSFDRNHRARSGRGPVRHSDMEPDKLRVVLI